MTQIDPTEVALPSPQTVTDLEGTCDRLERIADLLHESVVNAARQVDLTRVLAGAEVELRAATADVRSLGTPLGQFITAVDTLVEQARAAEAAAEAGADESDLRP